jgi:hypothetical protein
LKESAVALGSAGRDEVRELPSGSGLEVIMRKRMNRTTTRGLTYVSKMRAPWTAALHRKVAAAASAACVLSLQTQRRLPSDVSLVADERLSSVAPQLARQKGGSP